MKLLLLELLCLVAVASGRTRTPFPFSWTVEDITTTPTTTPLPIELTQESQDDFLVLAAVKNEDDLDPDEVQKLEKDGTVSTALKTVLAVSASSRTSLSRNNSGLPPAYQSAAKSSSVALFDKSSAKNEAKRIAVKPIVDPSGLYHCPHRTYLLRWFPLYKGGKLYETCFIPWATNQAITYAQCSTSTCPTRYWYSYPYYPYRRRRYGRCYVSCYVRMNITAYCVRLSPLSVSWKTITRNLPQACRCSTYSIK
ncbi:uncharacterized protein [Littorina saxatilis]|uniref:Uncharacterized protein n=1 Tax=Littorina saxatilis TaxID=31220 RepID=A0AAN9BHK2_9CAEN